MASTITRIFDKQPLRGERDIVFIGEILDSKLHNYMQADGNELPAPVQQKLEAVLSENYEHMKHFIGISEDDMGTTPGGNNNPKSPMLPPLSPPPMDDEVNLLEAQVEEATRKVAELRVSMQAQVQERLSEKLAVSRPTADWSPPPPEQNEADQTQDPTAEELRHRLTEAASKVPALLAQLEDAHVRLDRAMNTVQSEATDQKQPPNTIERAVLGIAENEDGDDDDITGQVSPALKQAVQAGQISTRRGRESIKPVPFNNGDIIGEDEGPVGDGGARDDADGNDAVV